MKILVSGDREWKMDNKDQMRKIYDVLSEYPRNSIIIHGDARGVDRMAETVANYLGMVTKAYPAKWEEQPKAAGAIRNRLMYNTEKPDLVIAFHNNLSASKGTKDMVMVAKRGGTPVRLEHE